MRRLPLIVSCLLVLGACDSEGTGDDAETEGGSTEVGSAAESGQEASGGTTGDDPTGASSADPTNASETGDPTGDGSTTGATEGENSTGETGIDDTTGDLVPELPPGDVDALIAWLQAGEYEDWDAESGIHESDGPHFGNVRTFFNNVLVDSFDSGTPVHPLGAANVKELYGPGQTIRGWSVMIKREVDAGQWYWFEVWDGEVLADTVAWDVCEDCHGDGTDNVLTPWPLQ